MAAAGHNQRCVTGQLHSRLNQLKWILAGKNQNLELVPETLQLLQRHRQGRKVWFKETFPSQLSSACLQDENIRECQDMQRPLLDSVAMDISYPFLLLFVSLRPKEGGSPLGVKHKALKEASDTWRSICLFRTRSSCLTSRLEQFPAVCKHSDAEGLSSKTRRGGRRSQAFPWKCLLHSLEDDVGSQVSSIICATFSSENGRSPKCRLEDCS